MKTIKMLTVVAMMLSAFAANAEHNEEHKSAMKADREAVNAACEQDAATANCAGKTVGQGLMKCIHAYKKEHKDFKVSDSCRGAAEKLNAARKAK